MKKNQPEKWCQYSQIFNIHKNKVGKEVPSILLFISMLVMTVIQIMPAPHHLQC